MHDLSVNIKRVALVAVVGFALQTAYLSYWQVFRAPELRADEHNSRSQDRLRQVEPGRLLDRTGEPLLGSRRTAEGYERVYPHGRDVCHITGYNSRTGIQAGLRDAFLGIGRYERPWHEFMEGLTRGNDVRLTVDLDAQQTATRMMQGRRGAVIALDARDGAILTMVSAPGYEPETLLDNKWEYNLFREDPAAPELNRVLQGLYPPGSVMKVFTAATVVDLGRVLADTTFDCDGSYRTDGATITCPRAHGKVTLSEALAVSCNTSFAGLSEYMTPDEFRGYVKRFHLLDRSAVPMPSKDGGMGDLGGRNAKVLLAETAFGQGQTTLTPLGVARLTLTIARGGEVLQPYLVAEVEGPDGSTLTVGGAQKLGQAVSSITADAVAGMMVEVVEDGTAQDADLRGVSVAAKTGSAENPEGEPHAWFTAFAPADDPRVVVTVVVEQGGSGAETALPIARRLMRLLLRAE